MGWAAPAPPVMIGLISVLVTTGRCLTGTGKDKIYIALIRDGIEKMLRRCCDGVKKVIRDIVEMVIRDCVEMVTHL